MAGLDCVLFTATALLLYMSTVDVRGIRAETDRFESSWAVEVKGGRDVADAVAAAYGMINHGQVGGLDDVWHFTLERGDASRSYAGERLSSETASLGDDDKVQFVEQQRVLHRVKRGTAFQYPTDQYWSRQWSLFNDGQARGASGRDINVVPAWIQGYTGKGTVVTVVDDGVQATNPDLATNFDITASYDFVANRSNPSPQTSDYHGTSCAGIIAMERNNYYCGAGVAYNCRIGGIRFNLGHSTDIVEAMALNFQPNYIDIYSNSWGPSDSGFIVGGPGTYTKKAMLKGIKEGRKGLGAIYVWAGGNGGHYGDSCAADGYVSSIYTIAVGSVDQNGMQAFYDENCSAKMATAYSYNSAGYYHMTTTSTQSACRSTFTGTSASAPLLAGMVALALEANSSLTWRDMQYLVAYTSNPQPLISHANWAINGAGHLVSSEFGFGVLDAEAFVTRARYWINVPEQQYCVISPEDYDTESSQDEPLSISFIVSSNNCPDIVFLEHVVAEMTLAISMYDNNDYGDYGFMDYYSDPSVLYHDGPRRGAISIKLTSPAGTVSTLLPERKDDFVSNEGYTEWPFMSVHHWGEDPSGEWVLGIYYSSPSGSVTVSDLNLVLYGTSVVPESVHRIPAQCSSLCERGCAASGEHYCDSCKSSRMPDTLKCVEKCPSGLCDVDGYCVDCNSSHAISPGVIAGISGVAALLLGLVVFAGVYFIPWRKLFYRYNRNYTSV